MLEISVTISSITTTHVLGQIGNRKRKSVSKAITSDKGSLRYDSAGSKGIDGEIPLLCSTPR